MNSKMFLMNKCFNLSLKNSIFNHKNKINFISISTQLIRFYSSKLLESKTSSSRRKCLLIAKQLKRRYLSSNSLKSDIDIKPKTSTTTQSSKPIESVIKSSPKPLGIIGFESEEFSKKEHVWTQIYSFPYIVFSRSFCRLKLYQTLISLTTVPLSGIFFAFDLTTIDVFAFYTCFSIFAMCTMFLFGQVFRRLVGKAYVSDDGSFVRLSHLSFFGNRIDEIIDISDIVPLIDTNFKLNDWYCRIERYSDSDVLFISLKFGGILHKEGFEKVFGEDSSKLALKQF